MWNGISSGNRIFPKYGTGCCVAEQQMDRFFFMNMLTDSIICIAWTVGYLQGYYTMTSCAQVIFNVCCKQ